MIEVEGLGPVGFISSDDKRVVAVAPWYQVYIMAMALLYHKNWLSKITGECNIRLGLDENAEESREDASGDPFNNKEECRINEILKRECALNASTYRSLAYASAYALSAARILSLIASDTEVKVRIADRLHLTVEAVAGGGERDVHDAEEAVRELLSLAVFLPLYLFSCPCQEKLVEYVFKEVREKDLKVYMFSQMRQAVEILESVADEVVKRGRAKSHEEYYRDILWRISYDVEYTLIDAMRDLVKLARQNASQKGGTGYKIVAEAAREIIKVMRGLCGLQPPIPPSEIARVLAVEGGIGLKEDYDSVMAGRLILGAMAPFTAMLTYRVYPESIVDDHGNTRIAVKLEKDVECYEGHPDSDPSLKRIVVEDPDPM